MLSTFKQSGWTFRCLSIGIGAVLVTAGMLKLIDLSNRLPYNSGELTPAQLAVVKLEGDRHVSVQYRLVNSMLSGAEILIGTWLLTGICPRWTRVFAAVVVLVLLNVAVAKGFEGLSSCGCFGRAKIDPWTIAVLDAIGLFALLVTRASLSPVQFRGWRIAGFVVSTAAVAGTLVAINRDHSPLDKTGERSVRTEDERTLLNEIIEGMEANQHAYKSMRLKAEVVTKNLTITAPERHQIQLKGGGFAATESRPITRQTYEYVITDEAVRCEKIPVEPAENSSIMSVRQIEIAKKESYLNYVPGHKRAWLRRPVVLAARDDSQIERCTWGLTIGECVPQAHPREWFDSLIIKSVARQEDGGQPGILVEAETGPQSRLKYEVITFFRRDRSYLPSWMEIRRNGRWLDSRVEVAYQSIPGRTAWVAETATNRLWKHETATAADQPGVMQIVTVKVGRPEGVDEPVPPETFDPPIPTGVIISDYIQTGQTITTSKPAPAASSVSEQISSVAPTDLPTRSPVVPLAILNLIILAGVAGFRRRIAF